MADLLVVQAFCVLDPCLHLVTQSDAADFLQHGNDKMKTLLKFYGKSKQVFQGHHTYNSSILNCTVDSLKLRIFKMYVLA